MAKHTESGKPNKNLLMHIRHNNGYSSKESRKSTEDNTQPGYTDDSRHHLKYMFMAQCENFKRTIDDLRNNQTEIIKKLDILESRTRTAMAGCKSRHGKQISVHEEASSLASSTLAHTCDKRDSGLVERLRMLEQLRRTHTSLVNDNRITNLENTKNVTASKTRSFVYFSNVQRFRTILSASEQHGDCVAFQDISTGATSEYNKNLDVLSGSHTRKPQARQLRRFKADTKEDNRIVSYEAQIEHVRDKKKLQSRTQDKEVTRHSQDDHYSTKSNKNKTETKTEILSTGESMTKPQADTSENSMPKSKKMSTEYSMKMKGAQTISFDESSESTASLMGAVESQLKSTLKQAFGQDSATHFKMMQFDEEQMKNMMKPDGTLDLMPALRTQLQTMLTEVPELSERIQMAETQESSGNESTASLMGAVESQLKSTLKQAFGQDSAAHFKMMQFDEEQMKNMMKPDGTLDLMPALRTQLQTMLTEVPQLSEHIQMAETQESSGNGFPLRDMSALPLMHSTELELAYWAEYEEGKKHREPGNSVETIICLDTSESMKGPSWTKAITFAKNFIQEVKNQPCGDSEVFERIGLVTFGHVTRIQVHLTRHYHQVLSKLDTLSPSGPTPMMPGLKMCAVAIVGAGGGNLQMNKMSILPRIILITDGKTTSHLCREGPDFSSTQDLDEAVVMNTVQEIKKDCQAHIDCVPLGESKIDFLTKIAQTTRGKIYQCEDWKKLGRRTKYLDVASQLYQEFLRMGSIDLIRNVIRTHWNVKGEDIDIIEESMRRSVESTEEEHFTEERINRLEDQLLLIGTRVRRGPDWHWGDQDSHGVGTVIGYDKDNWMNVVWDNYDSRGSNSNIYRYAVGGNFDVLPVEEPRVLSPGERIAVGCKVKRGKHWTSGDQDGGSDSVGTVIETADRSEEVMVRWPNRKSHKYKFGKKGKYEIQLCDTHESYTSNIMAEKETESVEGKLWKEMDRRKVERKVKDIDVEEMNRRNIEMSKCYITLPNSGGSVKESSGLKLKDSKVKMDTEVTLEHKNTKQNKNR